MVWQKTWDVQSDSDSSKTYRVSVATDGTWGCSCPAWVYKKRGEPRKICRHILKKQLELSHDKMKTMEKIVSQQVSQETIIQKRYSKPNSRYTDDGRLRRRIDMD